MNVILNGESINFAAAVQLMDDEIREELHSNLAPCTEQQFIDAYIDAHAAKHTGEKFHI